MKAKESQERALLAGKWPGERRGPEGLLSSHHAFSVKGQVARVSGFVVVNTTVHSPPPCSLPSSASQCLLLTCFWLCWLAAAQALLQLPARRGCFPVAV